MDRRRLDAWLHRALTRLVGDGSTGAELVVTAHLDEIDSGWEQAVGDLGSAVMVFKEAAQSLSADWNGSVSMVVAIGATSELQVRPRDLGSLRLSAEPPAIYLFDARYFIAVGNDREEYRCPYDEDPWGLRDVPAVAEFVSSRGPEERLNGWGFTNDLWLHRVAGVPTVR